MENAKIENLENMALLMADARIVMRRLLEAPNPMARDLEMLKYENAYQRCLIDIYRAKEEQRRLAEAKKKTTRTEKGGY